MTEWAYDRIGTHDADARARYTEQYADAANLKALTTLWAERVQALEDAAWSVLTERWLDVATGQQLDELGALVGEPRLARGDSDYRDAIQTRITINQSGGEPERIIEFFLRIAGADTVLLQEYYPATIEIFVGGDVSAEQAERVREIVPAGVGTIYVTESGGEEPFGTKDGPADNPQGVDGVGELGSYVLVDNNGDVQELSPGEIQIANDTESPILPTEGGYVAELYEV